PGARSDGLRLLGEAPVDMLVGAGNAFVTEAKRQLFGRVGIDLLAGPSEVAVIADDSADPCGSRRTCWARPARPQLAAALITTSEQQGRAVIAEVERQLASLATRDIAARRGATSVPSSWWRTGPRVAVADMIAPEHLEIQTEDDDYYLENLSNYGSLFIGRGRRSPTPTRHRTNHVLPTGKTRRYNAGLSVSRS
ncbi:histidinol dehydrogenase, partial [Streptomyces melanosporofaciens]